MQLSRNLEDNFEHSFGLHLCLLEQSWSSLHKREQTMYEVILAFYRLYALYMWMLEVEENIAYASIFYFR